MPGKGEESTPGTPYISSSKLVYDHVGWQFEDHVADEEDQQSDGGTIAHIEADVLVETRDSGDRDV